MALLSICTPDTLGGCLHLEIWFAVYQLVKNKLCSTLLIYTL